MLAFIVLGGPKLLSAKPLLSYGSPTAKTNLSLLPDQVDSQAILESDKIISVGESSRWFGLNEKSRKVSKTKDLGDQLFVFGDPESPLKEKITSKFAKSGGSWIGFSFTADSFLDINQIDLSMASFHDGKAHAARDVGVFLRRKGEAEFLPFGKIYDSDILGKVAEVRFSGNYAIDKGERVEVRFAFSDRTITKERAKTNQLLTLIGSIRLHGEAGEATRIYRNRNVKPKGNVLAIEGMSASTSLWGNNSRRSFASRGQTFTIPIQKDSLPWQVHTLSFHSNAKQSFAKSDRLHLWLFEWGSEDGNDLQPWVGPEADGIDDGDHLDGVTHGEVFIRDKQFQLPETLKQGDFLHLPLPSGVTLLPGKTYAISISDASTNIRCSKKHLNRAR